MKKINFNENLFDEVVQTLTPCGYNREELLETYLFIIDLYNDIVKENENEEVDAEWSPVNQISDWFYYEFTEKTKMVFDVVMYDLW